MRKKPVAIRSGCKVEWAYYRTKKEAETAAKEARDEALSLMSEGYDFGFLTPGTVKRVTGYGGDLAHLNGLWEVVLP